MLSILIPTYNYNVVPLVEELKEQADLLSIEYEILVQDDASNSEVNFINEKINSFERCTFFTNNTNLGRGKNLNFLAYKSKFNWLLFIDCDMFPTEKNYIKTYIISIEKLKYKLFYGGISYRKNTDLNGNLRYVYGRKRESLSVEKRVKKKNLGALTSNLVIHKTVFEENPFNEELTQYGYEDTLFLYNLESKKIEVKHLDNSLFHENIETSLIFLEKTTIAIENLKLIIKIEPKLKNRIGITKLYFRLKKWQLLFLVNLCYSGFEKNIINNLTSKKPSLIVFDFFKISNFCKVKTKNL